VNVRIYFDERENREIIEFGSDKRPNKVGFEPFESLLAFLDLYASDRKHIYFKSGDCSSETVEELQRQITRLIS
jgi:hypothetical protein